VRPVVKEALAARDAGSMDERGEVTGHLGLKRPVGGAAVAVGSVAW
jgi:hypothetical protein